MLTRLLAFVATFSLLTTPLAAQFDSQPVETGNARTELISEKTAIAPGETVTLGLYQELREGWHVYWKNPGDSGLPLDLRWTLPDGFSVSEVRYPTPHRLPLGPLVNFGHEGKPVFLVELTADDTVTPGTVADLSVDATWLICADVCIPENATLTATLAISETPRGQDLRGSTLIAKGRANMPVPAPFEVIWADINGKLAILLPPGVEAGPDPFFYPEPQGVIEPAGDVARVTGEEGTALIFTPAFEYDPQAAAPLPGVLTLDEGVAYEVVAVAGTPPAGLSGVSVSVEGPGPVDDTVPGAPPAPAPTNLVGILLGALLGGLILNIMPCVFPVVFLKAANIAQLAHEDHGTVIRHGLLYTLGILLTFLALAGVLLALRAGGEQVGWGYHLQSPLVVSVFAFIIMAVGLNLAGVFEVGTSIQGVGEGLASKGGNAGAFFTGLLAVAVAAPCVGPLLGVPLGVALGQSAPVALGIFALIGLGLALPYLLISLIPGLARLLPRPGPWMVVFKQLLSFAMFATLVWLVWTVTRQAGTDGLVLLGIGLVLVSFAAWAFGRAQGTPGGWSIAGRLLALLALVGAGWVIRDIMPVPMGPIVEDLEDRSKLPTVAFSPERLDELRAAGTPVFIDFTAAWCVTCQVNKQTVLTRRPVVDAFHDKGVIYMLADWTNQDPDITAALEAQGRSGVPLYLYYAPGAEAPQVLPQILSIDLMLETFSAL